MAGKKFNITVEEIGNGFLTTVDGYSPWFCKNIDEVNTSVRKKTDWWHSTKVGKDKKTTSTSE